MAQTDPLAALNAQVRRASQLGDSAELAVSLANLGDGYRRLAYFRQAEKTLLRSVEIWRELDLTASLDYARTLNTLGSVYADAGELGKAGVSLRDSLVVYRNLAAPPPVEVAQTLNNLGVQRFRSLEYADAQLFFLDSMREARAAGLDSSVEFANTLNNVAMLSKVAGDTDIALEYYRKAIGIWEKHQSAVAELSLGLHNLGVLEMKSGDTQSARTHIERALESACAAFPADHPNLAIIHSTYATLLKKIGRKKEARQQNDLARQVLQQHRHATGDDSLVDVRYLRK